MNRKTEHSSRARGKLKIGDDWNATHALDETNSGGPTFIWTDLPAMPLRMGLTVFGGLARGPAPPRV